MVLLNLNNSSVDFFQEKEIRKALLLGIDKKGLIKRVLNGQGVVADVPILKNSWAFFDGITSVEQNNQESERLLREAGYVSTEGSNVRSSNGNPLSFTMVHPDDAYHTGIAESLEIDWAKIGVEVNLLSVPYEALILDHLQPLTYEAALIDINYLNSPDPDPYPFWDQAQQTGGQNYSQWENRVASQYLEEARITADYDERAKLYRNFQVVFMDELPAIPLFYPVMSFAIDESVQGVRVGALYDTSDRFWNLPEWFLISQTGINTGE
jgi:peptide/nickel transport system substrate-binding protein